MSKGAYIGINNVAHKIKKGYIGVDGVARRIKKAYIGVGGVARPCWFEGKIGYYGTVAELSKPVIAGAASHIGNYAIFAGGMYNDNTSLSSIVDGYDRNLTKYPQINTLGSARYSLNATHNDNYVIFAGGLGLDGTPKGTVDAYDRFMNKVPVVGFTRGPGAAAHVGQYAVFFGVTDGYWDVCTYAYDGKLSQIYAGLNGEMGSLSLSEPYATASTVSGAFISNTDGLHVFDDQLNRKMVDSGFERLRYQASTSIGEYAIFAGGSRGNNNSINTVRYVDKKLTVGYAPSLGKGRTSIAATHIGDYAIFAFGSSYYNIGQYADFYDINLTRTFLDNSSNDNINKVCPKGTHIGDYALFASNGYGYGPSSSLGDATVRVYAVS